MILVLGGTVEGREIAGALAKSGYEVLVTVVSGYGAGMISEGTVEVLVKKLDDSELEQVLTDRQVRLIIDATHPYATVITETAWKTAQKCNLPYIRYERPPAAERAKGGNVYRASSYQEAAEMSVTLGNNVFLTIGSKNVTPFVKEGRRLSKRVVARVLPDPKVLEQCLGLGMAPGDIIAVQGPFSKGMNAAMFREYKAEVLVTKDSGRAGGTDAKLEAAAEMELPVIIVTRPDVHGLPVIDNIDSVLKKVQSILV